MGAVESTSKHKHNCFLVDHFDHFDWLGFKVERKLVELLSCPAASNKLLLFVIQNDFFSSIPRWRPINSPFLLRST